MRSILSVVMMLLLLQSVHSSPWCKATGRYANVEYLDGNAGLADSLLSVADRFIPKLCRWYAMDTTALQKDKARIILSDAPDVSNGYAIGDAVVIYALSSMYMTNWSGRTPWYDQVLSHELVHYITFRKLERKLSFLGEITGLMAPRWFYEGTAQYFSEDWNIYRGDIFLKNAILYGKLNYDALENLDDGALLYAAGHAFVRWLAYTYGDSCLVKLMAYNPKGWYYDFDEAFQAVYKKDPDQLFPDFIRHAVLCYGDNLADYPVSTLPKPLPVYGYRTQQMIPLSLADSSFVWTGRRRDIYNFRSLIQLKYKRGKVAVQKTISDALATEVFISPDKKYLAYGEYYQSVVENQYGLAFTWYVREIATGWQWRVAENVRARQAMFRGAEDLLLCEVNPDNSQFKSYNFLNGKQKEIFRTDMPVGSLAAGPDESLIFSAQRGNGNRDLFLLKDNSLTGLTNDAVDDRAPIPVNDSLLLFSRYERENPALAFLNLKDLKIRIALFDQFEYWLQSYDRVTASCVVSSIRNDREPVFSCIPVDSLLKNHPVHVPGKLNQYARWQQKYPPFDDLDSRAGAPADSYRRQPLNWPQAPMINILTMALPVYDERLGLGIYGITTWMEALQRQILSAAFVLYPKDLYQSAALLSHSIKLMNGDWLNSFYHGPVIFSYQKGHYVRLYQTIYSLDWMKDWFIRGNPRLRFRLNSAYSFYWRRMNEEKKGIPEQFNYHGMHAGITFNYLLPTRRYPVIPKRQLAFNARTFQSFALNYKFNVSEINLRLAGNIVSEEIGVNTRVSYIYGSGALPPLRNIGIDRFYEWDFPRDYIFTRTVRGVREDLSGKKLLWASADLVYFIDEKTGYQLLILPVDNLAASIFADFARISDKKTKEAFSFGSEISFGGALSRMAVGYAVGQLSSKDIDRKVYGRLTLYLTDTGL
jgi:hypothetical protein